MKQTSRAAGEMELEKQGEIVVVGFYYIHPRVHKLGQSLCDSLSDS